MIPITLGAFTMNSLWGGRLGWVHIRIPNWGKDILMAALPFWRCGAGVNTTCTVCICTSCIHSQPRVFHGFFNRDEVFVRHVDAISSLIFGLNSMSYNICFALPSFPPLDPCNLVYHLVVWVVVIGVLKKPILA